MSRCSPNGSISTLPADGDNFTLNRASPRVEDSTGARFDDIHGASLRAIFDLADLDRSRFVIAGGQSGNPRLRHYADFAPLLAGRAICRDRPGAASNRLRLAAGGAAMSRDPRRYPPRRRA